FLGNNTNALTYGFETTAAYQVNPSWRLFATYSLFQIQADGVTPDGGSELEGSSPNNMVYLRSSRELGKNVQWDLIGRYVDALTALDVPSYFEMDVRLGWFATESLELSFVGQNLLQGHHLEFRDTSAGTISTEVRRSWYGMVTWSY